jgi:uncharacterized membrane protein YagU involved in acid resistance
MSVRFVRSQQLMGNASAGVAAGIVATTTMSAWMLFAKRIGWLKEQPPQRMSRNLAWRVGRPVAGERLGVIAALAHFAIGMTAGAAFASFQHRRRTMPASVVAGIGYGLIVWFLGYVAVLPPLHLMPPPGDGERGRTSAMTVAHVVYGATLGLVVHLIQSRGR